MTVIVQVHQYLLLMQVSGDLVKNGEKSYPGRVHCELFMMVIDCLTVKHCDERQEMFEGKYE